MCSHDFQEEKVATKIKPFPKPFPLHFIETTDCSHKGEKGSFILISFSQETETSTVHEASSTLQHVFFLPGFMFSEYIKAQFCSSNERFRNHQGFYFHQPAPHFLFLELFLVQKVVTSRVPVMFSEYLGTR